MTQTIIDKKDYLTINKEGLEFVDIAITTTNIDAKNLDDVNNAFKDVFFLKETIKKYAIYLNLDEDEIIDKFNDFIFGYTSRIPINDILEQTKEFKILEKQKEDNKIVSPYTIKRKNNNAKYIIIYIASIIVLILLIFMIIKFITDRGMDAKVTYDNLIERRV